MSALPAVPLTMEGSSTLHQMMRFRWRDWKALENTQQDEILQEAGVAALNVPDSYYADLAANYTRRRNRLLDILQQHHFTCYVPAGAYYIMTDVAAFGFANDVEFARYLVKDVGVAAVPGSSFYRHPEAGKSKLRFCFCKRDETLAEADRRLAKLTLPVSR